MKKLNFFLMLSFVVLAVISNMYYLKIKTFMFIGIVLGSSFFVSVLVHMVTKLVKHKKGIKNTEQNSFIFPDKLSKRMKNADLSTQLESSVISISFLILGIIAFNIYTFFISEMSWPLKIFMTFNSACGLVLMSSMLVTYYQQLVAYRESTKFINEFASSKSNTAKTMPVQQEENEDYENYPDGYYLANDGNYYDYDGNQVYIEKNERGLHKR